MSQYRLARLSLLLAAIGLNVLPAVSHAQDAKPAAAAAAPADTVRPEIFKLLDPTAVKASMDAKNYADVQSRIDQAAATPALTPYETFVINRLRVALGSTTNNPALAMPALEAVIESGKLDKKSQGDFIQALANFHYNAKDYPNAIKWFTRYQTETGDIATVRPYIIRAYYFGNDFERAKKELSADLAAKQQANQTPTLEELQLLANTGSKSKDPATYLIAMENLVRYYPSDDYWIDLLGRVQGKAGYSDRFALDVLRLQYKAVSVMPERDYSDMAEIALTDAFPTEAKKVLDDGYAKGVLGKGGNAAKHKKLRDQANKAAADDVKNIASGEASANRSKDGTGLVNLGYAFVTMDQFDKGIDLIQKGIAKGGLKRPEDAKLRLGYSLAMAGKKDEAIKVLETVKGGEGVSDLARYWILWLNRPATAAAAPAAAAQ
ncbi:tetratricopeptide repeat protein [Janthinobacterium sp.]|uniref:tetratricopeptide repeat protein n=1 Tax=Janthinobacterium sp. TaxID=1871054 RepID=UPI00289C4463|nr:tetratricopeptide repeat protein [Janthinobacterium sp.]